jgi:uncharacterized protein
MMTQEIIPQADAQSEPYWEMLREGQLGVQRCLACGGAQFPFGPLCRKCRSNQLEWTGVSPAAEVYSWIVVHRCIPAELGWPVPYCVAVVVLENGVRIYAGVDASEADKLQAGARVHIDIADSNGVRLPRARLA